MRLLKKIKQFINEQVIPGIHAQKANNAISKFYEIEKSYEADISQVPSRQEEYIAKFESELKGQLERKSKLEDKAKSLLFIISIAITTMTFSLKYIEDNSNNYVSILFIVFSIVYFVLSGIRALQVLNVKAFHVSQPKVEKQNNFLILKHDDDDLILKELIIQKNLNDLIHIKISNLTFAAFVLIRNGIILFALFFICSVFKSLL